MRQRSWLITAASRLSSLKDGRPACFYLWAILPWQAAWFNPRPSAAGGIAGGAGELRRRLAGEHDGNHARIAAIDIATKGDPAVIARDGGEILDIDRDGLRQAPGLGLAIGDRLLQVLIADAQHMFHQRPDLLHPHAAMAESTLVRQESPLGGRVMQIDIEGVGHLELDRAQ